MKFKSIDDLVRYIVSENINLEYSDVEFKTDLSSPKKEEVKETAVNVKFNGLSDRPSVQADLGEENILYVESYESFKNLCGAGKVTMFGKTILSNVCEMDDEAHITLSVDIQEKANYNVDFKLKLLSEKAEDAAVIQIKETLLNDAETV